MHLFWSIIFHLKILVYFVVKCINRNLPIKNSGEITISFDLCVVVLDGKIIVKHFLNDPNVSSRWVCGFL